MNDESTPNSWYKKGSIVFVDRNSIDEMLWEAESVLGLPHRYNDYSIEFEEVPDQIRFGGYDSTKNTFVLPKKQHQAVLVHEGIHYLMKNNGLLLDAIPEKAGFYADLVDETIAYLGTAQVLEYTKEFIEETNNMYVLARNLTEFNLARKHTMLEEKYLVTKNDQELVLDVGAFFNSLKSELYDSNIDSNMKSVVYEDMVQILASRNSLDLLKNGFYAKELYSLIQKSVSNKESAIVIYFNNITENMNFNFIR